MKHPLALAVLLPWVAPACEQAPPEPLPASVGTRTRTAPRDPGWTWTVPASWTTEKTATSGRYRAKYRVPPAGDDVHPAEVLVERVGRGSAEDLDESLRRWRDAFESLAPETGREDQLTAGGVRIRMVELAGTYKFPMGPPLGPGGRHAAHVLKPGWRGIGAGVHTPRGELFWFRLVGPDDTVAAARSAMLALLKSIRPSPS